MSPQSPTVMPAPPRLAATDLIDPTTSDPELIGPSLIDRTLIDPTIGMATDSTSGGGGATGVPGTHTPGDRDPSGGATAATRGQLFGQRLVTALLVIGPGVALGIVVPLAWGHVISLLDIVLGVVLYLITGHGITIGFHRLFSHRSFTPNRALKIFLASAGSMAVQGSVIGWVTEHRRHHRFSEKPGNPHSPHEFGRGLRQQLRGFFHAHVGWLFKSNPSSSEHYAPDLVADKDLFTVSRLFPAFAIASFVLPFALGWAISGSVIGGLTALLWAGAVRMMLMHHVTWSINSVCHLFGKRPFRTRERSTNFAPLAVLSMGESWHNLHHAYPTSARHGALRGQVDSSARIISWFEKLGWAKDVRWPEPQRLMALAVVQADEPPLRTRRRR
ncbi:acyl-CoA desaturase [soil metagenome]